MASLGKPARPIIVIRKKIAGASHHGGAWKVAYADFMTAMMSLFIVLWLLNSTPQIKKAVAGYFNDPRSGGKETGTETVGSDESVAIDQKNVQNLKEEIEKAILQQKDLNKLSKQIEITVTGEGLKIDLIEEKGGTFFESGSPKLSENGVHLLDMLSGQLKALPNRLLIEGYTDAQPYSGGAGYSNWELSSDRANSTRRLLQQGGVGQHQISQVRGYADQMLRNPANPLDPSNRRVSLIVQWIRATGSQTGEKPGSTPDVSGNGASAAGAGTQPGPANQPNTPSPATADAGRNGAPSPALNASPKTQPAPATHSKPAWAQRLQSMVAAAKKKA